MTHVATGRDFAIMDDVMDPSGFRALRRELAAGRYESVHARGWDKAWRLGDGAPLRGSPVYYDPTNAFGRPGARYPT